MPTEWFPDAKLASTRLTLLTQIPSIPLRLDLSSQGGFVWRGGRHSSSGLVGAADEHEGHATVGGLALLQGLLDRLERQLGHQDQSPRGGVLHGVQDVAHLDAGAEAVAVGLHQGDLETSGLTSGCEREQRSNISRTTTKNEKEWKTIQSQKKTQKRTKLNQKNELFLRAFFGKIAPSTEGESTDSGLKNSQSTAPGP